MFNEIERAQNDDDDDDDDLSGEDDAPDGEAGGTDEFGAHEGDLDDDEEDDDEEEERGDPDAIREKLKRLEQELADELAAEEDEEADGGGDGGAFEGEDDEDDDEDDEEEHGGGGGGGSGGQEDPETAAAAALARRRDYAPSVFQRAQDKLARQISTLEERAIQEKTWLLKGEASAKERPKNSVLEADLEFDHVQAPPPVVSEEMTAKLEDIIKARIAEQRFDDVERVEPGLDSDRRRKALPELDDSKSKKGLGDLYADDYVRAREAAEGKTAATEEKEDPLVVQARSLFRALTSKLDALSHFHFAPKPVMEEMSIKVDAPALQIEEVAPAMASEASRKAPEEVFAGGGGAGGVRGSAAGNVKSEGEMTQEDRKAARAKRKRKSKASGLEKERVKTKRGRVTEAKETAAEEAGFARKAPKVAMLAAQPAGGRSKSEFSKSSKVFSMLQEQKEADAAGRGGKVKKTEGMTNKSALKL